ncbi:double zinc ribbon domain-containing protein [Lacrimispora sp. AGF001]|uniref:double zinc ribbon domain-containing protein n=1 Tax=Lacrimispora sp. AGF001 TaxID=3401631 RepID=UPI003B431B14
MQSSFIIDLLFPRRCPVCDGIVMPKGRLICPDCVRVLSFVKDPVCKKCGKELFSSDMEYCFDCVKHRRTFEYGRALINYDEHAKTSMAKIKYKNKREYLDFYGDAISLRYEKLIRRMEADGLVPVPVHPSRKKERGFNQAEVLAQKIGAKLNIPVFPDILVRNKKTMPQKALNPTERLKNLEEAFMPGKIVAGVKNVILIDDIYTTGSTVEACTRVLKKSGINKVYILTICIGRGQ